MKFFQMIKFILLMFVFTACGTAPITAPPAEAFELEIERGQWDRVYHAIEYLKIQKFEKEKTQPSDTINNALDNYWEQKDGSNDPTKSEELL